MTSEVHAIATVFDPKDQISNTLSEAAEPEEQNKKCGITDLTEKDKNIEKVLKIRCISGKERWGERIPVEEKKNIKIYEVKGDGSCFFRSVAKALQSANLIVEEIGLTGEITSEEIRNKIMDSITADEFKGLLNMALETEDYYSIITKNQIEQSGGDFKKYIELMKNLDQWASQFHIQKFCDIYGINLLLLKENCENDGNSCVTRIIPDKESESYVVLTYSGAHYNLVVYTPDMLPIELLSKTTVLSKYYANVFIENLGKKTNSNISANALISTSSGGKKSINNTDEYDMFKYIPITPMSIPLSGANLIEEFSNILHDILKKKPRK